MKNFIILSLALLFTETTYSQSDSSTNYIQEYEESQLKAERIANTSNSEGVKDGNKQRGKVSNFILKINYSGLMLLSNNNDINSESIFGLSGTGGFEVDFKRFRLGGNITYGFKTWIMHVDLGFKLIKFDRYDGSFDVTIGAVGLPKSGIIDLTLGLDSWFRIGNSPFFIGGNIKTFVFEAFNSEYIPLEMDAGVAFKF